MGIFDKLKNLIKSEPKESLNKYEEGLTKQEKIL